MIKWHYDTSSCLHNIVNDITSIKAGELLQMYQVDMVRQIMKWGNTFFLQLRLCHSMHVTKPSRQWEGVQVQIRLSHTRVQWNARNVALLMFPTTDQLLLSGQKNHTDSKGTLRLAGSAPFSPLSSWGEGSRGSRDPSERRRNASGPSSLRPWTPSNSGRLGLEEVRKGEIGEGWWCVELLRRSGQN